MLVKDKDFLKAIEKDLGFERRPFAKIAKSLGVSQEKLFDKIKLAKKEGFIRRYGALLAHRESGFKHNAMVVFSVPQRKADIAGKEMASKKFVSHCYRRQQSRDWPYNLYAMVHATSLKSCEKYIDELKLVVGDYPMSVLKSGKEFKKTSLKIL